MSGVVTNGNRGTIVQAFLKKMQSNKHGKLEKGSVTEISSDSNQTQNLIEQYLEGGQIPWSSGYKPYRMRLLQEVLRNEELLQTFWEGESLPENYGFGIDERIVEYPLNQIKRERQAQLSRLEQESQARVREIHKRDGKLVELQVQISRLEQESQVRVREIHKRDARLLQLQAKVESLKKELSLSIGDKILRKIKRIGLGKLVK